MRKDTLLIIPAFNEEENLRQILEDLIRRKIPEQMDLLVINDGSTDRTAEILQDFAPGIPSVHQLYNLGYGAALQTGYKYAVRHGYRYLLQMDADGQHDPENLTRLLSELKAGADIVIGSRFLAGGKSFPVSRLKKIAIRFFCSVIRILTGSRLTDPTSGLQGLNRKAFSYYAGFSNFDIRYPDLNMILQMLFLDFHVKEVPAVMHARTAGTSMHAGLLHACKYMLVMFLSAINAFNRYYRLFSKERKKTQA